MTWDEALTKARQIMADAGPNVRPQDARGNPISQEDAVQIMARRMFEGK